MRKLISFLLLIISMNSYTQQIQVRIDQYVMPSGNTDEKSVVVEMLFGKPDIIRVTGDVAALKSAGDVIIDIICTDYPSSASLVRLNDDRARKLFQLFPELHQKNTRKINFLRQLDGNNRVIAQSMFHGAVIRFRPAQTKEKMKAEVEQLEAMLVTNPGNPSPVRSDSVVDKSSATVSSDIEKDLDRASLPIEESAATTSGKKGWCGLTSLVEPDIDRRDKTFFPKADSLSIMTPLEAMKKGYIDRKAYNRTFSKYPKVTVYYGPGSPFMFGSDIDDLDSTALVKDSTTKSGYSINPDFNLPDSTIFSVLKRNKWKDPVVVADVTGSMYPYTAQLLLWLKLQSLEDFTTKFAFFNDGDDIPDDKKLIGCTGGIYFKRCYSFDDAKALVKSTMLKGGGGDCPENDIEALLLTEKEFPGNAYQVLIADNWAPIKDKSLINKLTKPVRVVLCGATGYGINVDYLNLARKTGGSLHLMEQDLYDLASLHEGEVLKIGSMHFRIVDGGFKEIPDPGKVASL